MNVYIIQTWKRKVAITQPRFENEFLYDDVSEITVEAETEKEALVEAKKMLKRKGYRVAKVWKKETIYEDMQMLSLELQKKSIDILTGKRKN